MIDRITKNEIEKEINDNRILGIITMLSGFLIMLLGIIFDFNYIVLSCIPFLLSLFFYVGMRYWNTKLLVVGLKEEVSLLNLHLTYERKLNRKLTRRKRR
jgi:hypothetical protein